MIGNLVSRRANARQLKTGTPEVLDNLSQGPFNVGPTKYTVVYVEDQSNTLVLSDDFMEGRMLDPALHVLVKGLLGEQLVLVLDHTMLEGFATNQDVSFLYGGHQC
jgi:hypothetical protein